MKVVILAAGVGSRLRPETDDKPKAMIRVEDQPLVQYQVDSVRKAGFKDEDIYVLGGYKMERIQEHFAGTNIQFIYNPYYESMNNIYSFLLTKEIGDDLLLINSDDFFDERLIPLILADSASTSILVDTHKELTEESMRVKLDRDCVIQINKKMGLTEADGEYIGISKLAGAELEAMYRKAAAMIDNGDTKAWYENVYEACASDLEIVGVDTKGYAWVEIDDFNDLETAKKLAASVLS
ncbi:NTP transferase domain-containing protein [Paludifilum halophilum]|uniref:Nucleotidyl transferase n=1 Tax=Paludifilum halophilum TaxID=1642702 RepID=A0A235B7G0_9BACL|nr:phosphocholine cytidylyltransferase family protein [Paludifilum halophilum]OYD07535.1 nucleotidyl transferase [Paludifilum halophilum]